MKVIDKSNREILLEFLKLPDDIREYDINKQYTILHDKIEVLEKSIFLDDSIIEHNDYTPSNRQDATWQNALRNFQAKDYLNAYFEIIDYIDDYGNRENRNLFESEMNNIKSIFRGINKKIQEIINFDNEKEEIKLKGNTSFNLYMTDGSMIDNDKRKTIKLEGNNITIYWNRNITNIINCSQIANDFRQIISKYEDEINQYAKIPNGDVPITGTFVDSFTIVIDNKEYQMNTLVTIEVNDIFYEKMKNEIYSFVQNIGYNDKYSVIRKMCIDKDGHKYEKTTISGQLSENNNLKLSEEMELLDKDDNTNTNMDKDDINKKYKGISGIISVKNILGFLPKPNAETGNVINKKININLPYEFQPMKSMPEDPKDSVVYGKQTSSATCIAMLYYINKEDAMPYNNEKIINGIHNTLGDDQGLIEVNSGSTKNNKKYVYSIVKTRKEPSGIQYTLTFQIEMQEGILNIQAFFDEIGVTGQRESIIMAKMINEGKINPINPNEMNAWMKDPYDETYNKGLRMNLAEKEEYDVAFPEHPLSEARNLVKIIIEKN